MNHERKGFRPHPRSEPRSDRKRQVKSVIVLNAFRKLDARPVGLANDLSQLFVFEFERDVAVRHILVLVALNVNILTVQNKTARGIRRLSQTAPDRRRRCSAPFPLPEFGKPRMADTATPQSPRGVSVVDHTVMLMVPVPGVNAFLGEVLLQLLNKFGSLNVH